MKRLFTLIAAVMLVSVGFAQHGPGKPNGGYGNDRDVVYNDRNDRHDRDDRYRDRSVYSFSPRERDQAINAINREYDRRSQQIRYKAFMSPYKKTSVLRQLEQERRQELSTVYAKFNSPKNVFGDKRNRRY